MKKIILIFSLIFFIAIIIVGCVNSNNNDLGIVANRIETYFYSDTAHDEQKISFYPKYNKIDSFYYQPYKMRIVYGKEYDEKKANWKLDFHIAHYYKSINVYPSKGILKIDDYEIKYGSVTSFGGNEDKVFYYGTLDEITTELNHSEVSAEIISKLANAKIVKFTAIGREKQEFIWSPKILDDAKNTLKYFDSLKTTTPSFK